MSALRSILPALRGRLGLVFLDQAVVSACNFLIAVVLIRTLGLDVFGAFGMVSALGLFVAGLQLAFVSQPMMSIGPKQAVADRPGYYGAVLVLQLGFTLLAGIGTVLAYRVLQHIWSDSALEGTLFAGVAMIVARQMYAFVRNHFFATERVGHAFAVDTFGSLGQVGAMAYLGARGDLTLRGALWVSCAFFLAASSIGLFGFARIRLTKERLHDTASRHWRFSRWLGLMSALQWFSSNAFLLAAGATLGSAAVGALKAAHHVIGVLNVALVAIENFLPVDTAKAYARAGMRGLAGTLRPVLTYGLCCTASVAAAIIAWPHLLLELLYAEAVDAQTIAALRSFAVLYVLGFIVTVLNIGFRSIERTFGLALCHMLVSLPVMAIAYPVVEQFGFAGVLVGIVAHKLITVVCLGATFATITGRELGGKTPLPQIPE